MVAKELDIVVSADASVYGLVAGGGTNFQYGNKHGLQDDLCIHILSVEIEHVVRSRHSSPNYFRKIRWKLMIRPSFDVFERAGLERHVGWRNVEVDKMRVSDGEVAAKWIDGSEKREAGQ